VLNSGAQNGSTPDHHYLHTHQWMLSVTQMYSQKYFL